MTSPCPNCPFRTDIKPFLNRARATEIADSLTRQQQTFQCHATIDYHNADDDGNGRSDTANAQHCAGAMIMLERMGRPNQMMRICERIGMYDRSRLDMDAPVFSSPKAFISAQSQRKSAKETA